MKPEALRLADRLDLWGDQGDLLEAAAELRRLHEAHDWQYRMAGERLRRVEKLEAQRDALLEALRAAVADWDEEVSRGRWLDTARAAITKAEEA